MPNEHLLLYRIWRYVGRVCDYVPEHDTTDFLDLISGKNASKQSCEENEQQRKSGRSAN